MSVIEIAAIATALAAVVSIIVITTKLGHLSGEVQTSLSAQKSDISEMREDIKALNSVVTQLAVTQERLDTMSAHIVRIDKRVDLLAQGEGFIFPLGSHFPPKTKLG